MGEWEWENLAYLVTTQIRPILDVDSAVFRDTGKIAPFWHLLRPLDARTEYRLLLHSCPPRAPLESVSPWPLALLAQRLIKSRPTERLTSTTRSVGLREGSRSRSRSLNQKSYPPVHEVMRVFGEMGSLRERVCSPPERSFLKN
jgi:hypothetical protein